MSAESSSSSPDRGSQPLTACRPAAVAKLRRSAPVATCRSGYSCAHGLRRFDDPGRAEEVAADPNFVGWLGLKLAGSGPWQLSYSRIETLDEYEHYVFVSRRETPEEYRQRTGSSARPVAAAGPARGYRIVAGFAEHDERFGSRAAVEVQLEAAPTREEAVQLVWPAVKEETRRALGEGDWLPSLNWVDVFELLSEAPPG